MEISPPTLESRQVWADKPWIRWAIAILVLLAVGLGARVIARNHAEDPLKGDDEEATAGLSALLEKTPDAERLPLLRKEMNNENPGLRYAALEALAQTKDPSVADDIERALEDSSSMVRQRAIESMAHLDKERGFRLMVVGLQDEDTWVQESAINQIIMGVNHRPATVDKRIVPFLVKSLDNPSSTVSTLAIDPLRKLTGQPWKAKKGASEQQRRAVIEQWKGWWKQAQHQFPVSPELFNLNPVRPARSDAAPDFRFADIEGKPVSRDGQRNRVTLLNFWGTWCPPCRFEIPELVTLDKAYGPKGLDIIGLAVAEDNKGKGLKTWCKQHSVEYRQALSTPEVQEAFGHIEEVPVSVLIDKQGRIRYRWEGERDFATFSAAVQRLLSE